MTGKPFHEVTGFAEYNKSSHGTDQVAIEMVSNTGTAADDDTAAITQANNFFFFEKLSG